MDNFSNIISIISGIIPVLSVILQFFSDNYHYFFNKEKNRINKLKLACYSSKDEKLCKLAQDKIEDECFKIAFGISAPKHLRKYLIEFKENKIHFSLRNLGYCIPFLVVIENKLVVRELTTLERNKQWISIFFGSVFLVLSLANLGLMAYSLFHNNYKHVFLFCIESIGLAFYSAYILNPIFALRLIKRELNS